MWWLQLLGTGSIGSLLTILINKHFKQKENEKRIKEANNRKILHQLYFPLYFYFVILIKCLSEIQKYLTTILEQPEDDLKIDSAILKKINSIMQYHVRAKEVNEKIFFLLSENFGYLNKDDDIGIIQYIELSERVVNIEWSNINKKSQVEGLVTAYKIIIKLLENIKGRAYISICEYRHYLGFETFDESIERLRPLIKKSSENDE